MATSNMDRPFGFRDSPAEDSPSGTVPSLASGESSWRRAHFNSYTQPNDGAEGRTRRKLQKHPTGPSKGAPKRDVQSTDVTDAQSSTARRPSIRHYQPPKGARPLTRSPSKITTTQSATDVSHLTSRFQRANAHVQKPSVEAQGQFNFGIKANIPALEHEKAAQSAFEVNFDDLHTRLVGGTVAETKAFGASQVPQSQSDDRVLRNGDKSYRANQTNNSGPQTTEVRLHRTNSTTRQQPESRRRNVSAVNNQIGHQPSSMGSKARRQSHFPSTNAEGTSARNVRKSIGPGFFLPAGAQESDFLNISLPNNRPGYTRSVVLPNSPAIIPSRNFSGPVNSPARESLYGDTTPSSDKRSKRASTLARAVSPTDARRAKRMSMLAPPPLPSTPPVTFPEPPSFNRRSAVESPSMIPRKSVTPSSNRTTPDPNRKSINSAVSVSSSASVTSLRGALAPNSRLPTLRSRNEAAESEELIPPVPAIPRAYDSPLAEHQTPFLPKSQRMPSFSHDVDSITSTSTAENGSAPSTFSSEKETAKAEPEGRTPALNCIARADEIRASGAQDGRRTLQPIQIPPFTLMPPGVSDKPKNGAWPDPSPSKSPRIRTPPPRRGRTPVTPMTASRASFFHSKPSAVDGPALTAYPKLRSTSSHFASRSDASGPRAPSQSSNETKEQRLTSPFNSATLPKQNGIYVSPRARSGSRSFSNNQSSESKHRLTGPRAQNTRGGKTEFVNGAITPSTDTETISFGTTLRRKLSLTRKRSLSRSASKAEGKAEGERLAHDQDREAMPPPKLPASATWTSVPAASTGPSKATNTTTVNSKPAPFLHTRRKSSLSESLLRRDRARSEVFLPEKTHAPGPESSMPNLPAQAGASIPTTNGHRSLAINGIKAPPRLQAIDARLDRDDLIAEEEMRRLARRKSNTETAARELDELRERATSKDPISPQQALRTVRLNLFERGEIVDFKHVYFAGKQNARKIQGDPSSAEKANFGYDDDRGDYNIVLGDHLAYRYEIVDILGKGSFGQVVRCIDHKTGGLVAVKCIRNKKRFHQQALVEVNILKRLREWDPESRFSAVNFIQSFYFRGHLCISTELLGMNLYEFIKTHDFKGFSLKLIRRFTKQMLNSLILLRSKKVIHCDLKPENILLAHPARSEIKVIDFGSSCMENEKVYTYIQSRFYRSPEVILGMSYGMPIDMWSLGCILAELLTGFPIFPGENEQEQLACIMEVFGPPDKTLIEKASRRKLFFDSLGKPRLTVSSKGKRRRPSSKTLQQALKCDDAPFLDFLGRCLRWDPDRRIKPEEAAQHEFITGVKASARTASARAAAAPSTNASPIKRFHSMHTSGSTAPRPLPETPATSLRNGQPVRVTARDRSRDALIPSPSKAPTIASAVRRHSTLQSAAGTAAMNGRKASNSISTGGGAVSTLPRPGPKVLTTSTKAGSGLASAAAAAAITVPPAHF